MQQQSICSKCGFLVFMMALGVICDFASLRTCTEWQMPDWLSWGNLSSCRLLRRNVFRGSDMIGHRSAGAGDEVASCLARRVVLGSWGCSRERTCIRE